MIKTAVAVALADITISPVWAQTIYQCVGNTTYSSDGISYQHAGNPTLRFQWHNVPTFGQ